MKKFLEDILKDIRSGKNIDAYVAILIGCTLAVLGLNNKVTIEILGAAILGSLSWLIINSISTQREREKVDEELVTLLLQKSTSLSADNFFLQGYVHNSEEFQNSFEMARELYVVGMGQNRFVTSYGGQIQRILSVGGAAKFILTDPDGHGMSMVANRASSRESVTTMRQSHLGALGRLASISNSKTSKGKMEIKLIDSLMPYTLYGFDLQDSKKGKIFVWLTPFREPSESRPGFVISFKTSPKWYKFFREQFYKMWDCEIVKDYPI